jgi:hypothetical protein
MTDRTNGRALARAAPASLACLSTFSEDTEHPPTKEQL